ncbi:protein moonraker [Spea bombifrons]|uniref:protein moonraker n=1 Tax=Spea bombifrons TaxID=233779 RepID=UPI00234A7875|nr:protein moonraker [Spea bombifrons]
MASDGQHQLKTTQTFLSGTSAAHYLPHRVQPAIYHTKGNQLQFKRGVPTHPSNLATHFSNPSPIVIEKLGANLKKVGSSDEDDPSRRSSPSISFSVISEERLNLAVWLAKRDLKRKHLVEKQEVIQSLPEHEGPAQPLKPDLKAKRHIPKDKNKVLKAVKPEVTKSGARVYVYTSDKNGNYPRMSDSPPTHETGSGSRTIPETAPEPSGLEVKRLQKEMCTYMQKIEELAHKGHAGEILDPDEQARGRIRQKERAAHSARTLYVLQQQVKELQEELDQPQKIKHTKKSRTMSRLAAVYRGAIRALQLFVTQLSERGEQQVPALYKELVHVVRQLTLCTAKVETGSDPAASSTIFSILQQAEDLDLLLEHKVSSYGRRASPKKVASRSPSAEKRDDELPSRPPVKEKKGPPPIFKQRLPLEKSEVRKQPVFDNTPESLTTGTQTEPIHVEDPPTPERRAALRSGLEALIQAGGLKGIPRVGTGHDRRKGVLQSHKPQRFRQPSQPRRTEPYQGAHFQKKTVAFALKENHPPVKEKRTPWLPPNKTSPPASPKKIHVRKEDKRLNRSPTKNLDNDNILTINQPEKEDAIAKEAVRLAWLDAETARRIQELDNLYREEMSRLQNVRKFREQLLQASDLSKADNTQRQRTFNKADLPENVINKGSLETGQCSREDSGIQDVDLEAMIQRIEEIEKFQEIVQRRNHATYADPEFWAQEEKDRTSAGKETIPRSPHPIMITKPTGQREPVVDIFLEEPFEGDSLQVSKEELARSSPLVLPERPTVKPKGLIEISVPTQMLQNIKNYHDSYECRLRRTSDSKEGSFNSRYIFESMADDLLEEALNEVAAEYLDLCDSYADALYTSEFLEPLKTS